MTISTLDNINLPVTWLTIGSFDGVHRGHQELIRGLVNGAHQAGAPAVVLTFYPLPAVILRWISGAYYLSTPDERLALLKDFGVDEVITLVFDLQMASLTAEDFMAQVIRHLSPQRLWVGRNFTIGRDRKGDVAALQGMGERLGYQLMVVPPVIVDGQVVSSTLLRQLLLAGEVGQTTRGLGRYYSLTGKVVHGDGRGHGMGIPTANLETWSEQIVPANGIYACWAWVDGQRWAAVVNIGVRPTFESQGSIPRVEAYLLDFDQDLYGKRFRLEFVARLREERRFTSVEGLLNQIRLDIIEAKRYLV